jgi:peptide/nickel transport system substrate-binding protein
MNRRGTQREPDLEHGFEAQMAAYLKQRGTTLDRRDFLRLATGASAVAWARPVGRVLAQEDNATFAFGLDGEPASLEPALSYDSVSNPVVCQISEGLLMFDREGALLPLLAEEWEQPDPLTYVYRLRQGVTFHDGATMTSADVVASIARVRDPEVASPMAWMYDAVDNVEAPDEGTVRITLKSPSALFRYVPAVTAGHVVSKAAIEMYGAELTRNPVGTGPYRFVAWDAGSQIELEKNPDYWQAGKPSFERVVFKIVREGTARTAGLRTGDIQAEAIVPADQIPVIRELPNVAMQETVGYGIDAIAFRTDQPPFDDRKVRQAVARAIDVEAIMANIVKEAGVRSRATTVPPNMPGSASDVLTPVPYDLAEARRLLAESAHPNGLATTLTVSTLEDWVAEAVYVQEALQELGIEVEVVQLPWEEVVGIYQSGAYEGMIFFGWFADFPDASAMLLPIFHSKNVPPQPNVSYYTNPRVDELLDASEVEQDPEKRLGMLVEVQELIAADEPVVWLSHPKQFWPMAKAVTGYEVGPLWGWDAFARDLKPA